MNDDANEESIKFTALEEGTWGNKISIEVKKAADPNCFKLSVKFSGTEQESFDNLTMADMDKLSSAYIKVEKAGDSPKAVITSYSIHYTKLYDLK